MIKKLFFAILSLICFSGFVFADFGVNVRGGKLFGGSCFGEYDNYYVIGGAQDYKADFFNYGADVFFERKISNEIFGFEGEGYIGVKVGFTKYEENYYGLFFYDSSYGYNDLKLTSNAYAMPIMIYYKYKDEDKPRIRVWGGLGAELLFNEYNYKSTGLLVGNVQQKETSSAIIPKIELGVEYVLAKSTSLFFSFGYQFNGKVTTDLADILFDETYVDFSGITFNIGISFNIIKDKEEEKED
ncbi:MAG: hypothetical protein FWD54_03285 [Endomicrobia bacterium]|nr:hypothetical protein [Endomicrobiia bacterium]MCL2799286.1 hypothetical protein [Endomicrobiia bacterium]